jgi:phosphoribosylamine--glycine ligase
MNGNCVIKYDGLAAGKGVFVCSKEEDALAALDEIHSKYGEDASYLIEEKLVGDELSILAFTDGEDYQLLLPSQDHKQLLEGDNGPNTGGMGAFCPVPFYNEELKKQIENDIIKPTLKGIKAEGFNYKGVIYFGLMITETGSKLLEYNVRLGDPETEVVLPALKSDLLKLILSCFDGTLKDYKMEFNNGFFVDVVLVSGGYPAEYKKGIPICGIKEDQELIFHAGTKKENDRILTNGGRVLNIVAHGNMLNEAINKAYERVNDFYFEDMFFRKDIGRRKKN